MKYDEVHELCQVTSIAECSADDSRFPDWLDDTEYFTQFQEQYVADVETARACFATEELVEKCATQLGILEELLIEKKAIVEEASIKKKKGKKSKKVIVVKYILFCPVLLKDLYVFRGEVCFQTSRYVILNTWRTLKSVAFG